VTGRHHGACLALRAGVPFVTLPSNTWKVEGLLELLDGYPEAAADLSLPLIDRVEAARAHRAWFRDASHSWASRLPLPTFDRLSAARRSHSRPAPPRKSSPETLDAIRVAARPDGGILHVGCGRGDLIVAVLAQGHDAAGVEISADVCAHARVPDRVSIGLHDRLPFEDRQFATVVVDASWLEHLDQDDLDGAVAEIARVTSDAVIVETTGRPWRTDQAEHAARGRQWWERRPLDAGLRRHTRSLAIGGTETLDAQRAGAVVVMQRPRLTVDSSLDNWDALRASGATADAALAAYEWARGWIKPGDVVVDVDCGAGFGTALLWDGSEAAQVVGIDARAEAVEAATAEYAPGRRRVEFRIADDRDWQAWLDNSVDCVVCLRRDADAGRQHRLAVEAHRILRPGGRLVCRTIGPDDPGVRAWPSTLLVDAVHALSTQGAAADRWLLSAIKDPLVDPGVPYIERVFPAAVKPAPNAIAFDRDYLNPWAVHALVMGQFRVRSPRLLRTLACRWLECSPLNSADAGAALCVLAYREIEEPDAERFAGLIDRIDEFCRQVPANPHMHRWQISLRFAAGQLQMRRGDLAAAEQSFRACANADASRFSPHLETKTTEAAWLAGRLALARGARDTAAADWRGSFAILERLKSTAVADWLITPGRPAAFEFGDGLREIAIAIDNAARAANGLRHLHELETAWRPGPRPSDRNFQINTARLLDAVTRRGGEILALRDELENAEERRRGLAEELNGVQEGWRADGERWRDQEERWRAEVERWRLDAETWRAGMQQALMARSEVESRLARVSSERAAIAKRLRQMMKQVVIFGAGDEGRRVWEALAGCGADVAGFVESDERRHGREFLGTTVHPPQWLAGAWWDLVAVASLAPAAAIEQLHTHGVRDAQIVVCPVERDDESLAAWMAQRFPDPLATTWGAAVPAGLRIGIFGTGAGGLRVWEALSELDGCDAAWFADNNPSQQGRTMLWLDVIAPAHIRSREYDAFVIGSMSRAPIERQLLDLGVSPDHILAPDLGYSTEHVRLQLETLLPALSVGVTP
jgi:SAM-dependent methyltransferase